MKRIGWLISAALTIGLGAVAGADEGRLPSLDGAATWLNSAPLNGKALRGKVVLVNFWTYSCINSLRELPYIKAWAAKYKDAGLVVVGVHTGEFGFESEPANVRAAVAGLGVQFPVAIDSERAIWSAFHNEYWPADYVIDGNGRIRYHHFGEGDYEKSESVIRELLRENGAAVADDGPIQVTGAGPEAPASDDVQTPETYAGYARAEHFASRERMARDSSRNYRAPVSPTLNQWGLDGSWKAGAERTELIAAPGKLIFRFHARDLHMVSGDAKTGRGIRFRVTLNGAAPGRDHGSDCGPDGYGEIREPRLYQLIRQKGPVEDSTVEIEFLDPGVEIFSFTFG